MTELDYKQDHKIAKTIVCFLVISLLLLSRHYNLVYLDIIAVVVWMFGVNAIGYLIETIRGHQHRHDKI